LVWPLGAEVLIEKIFSHRKIVPRVRRLLASTRCLGAQTVPAQTFGDLSAPAAELSTQPLRAFTASGRYKCILHLDIQL
jgi:hypothetical protein